MLALALLLGQDHHPSVFRAVFEDRPRQLIVVLGRNTPKPVGFIIHPDLGGVRKVWEGTIDYRGKVYDFSQNNSRAEGRTLWEAPERVLEMPTDAAGWTLQHVSAKEGGWEFDGPDAAISSPEFRADVLQTAYVGFDEIGTKTRFTISLIDGSGKVATEFGSSTAQDNGWQWNFKRLPSLKGPLTMRVTQKDGSARKRIRNLRVFGDLPIWFDGAGRPLKAQLLGYNVDGPDRVSVDFRVGNAKVTWTPSVSSSEWTETFTVSGAGPTEANQLQMYRPGSQYESVAMGNSTYTLRFAR